MEFREGLNPISKADPAFRVSASLFMSRRGLTAVLVVTALLITAGVKPSILLGVINPGSFRWALTPALIGG